ncbi:uncharacterized protein T551_00051 [Pneumocystis jirovecii RU7]|uniref:Nucleolar GTP-binding protein 1 n=1 Tax=Pneumocystis jirovecii (strain RU7) TaxID=1408657 RepID=A0A0W4ZW17_PNEJ7|nr:uncharacterized protein T551_00051 [Pneumocystis jirovecii RU7]KTW32566.1 hypothetical protein T551_00051 [Pneumocystis jirovecii RU7]
MHFKSITQVPPAKEFLDIVLSKTQRKTPTVVRPGFKISRIRSFYMKKVTFTKDTLTEKLQAIIDEFPRLNDLHPFYSDLLNILYDKDHFKIALSHIATAKQLIETVARDYIRLLKYGDSLYRCKQLKRAALGRMATIIRRQSQVLTYLEQVRQHLARLPSIEPNTRTLLICGLPNVGKSSFMNKITRADVEEAPYPFTTKSLFVGHMDYKYLRWQVIDTPGILDHPLEDMNTIEMQSITALAHLRACILYFMDLSEHCGYPIESQVKLFHSLKPLFSNKTTVLVINKIDIMHPDHLDEKNKALIQTILDDKNVQMVQTSCVTEDGVMNVRNMCCDKLLESRIEVKLKDKKSDNILNRIHLAKPVVRDAIERLPLIPEAAKNKKPYDWNNPDRRKLEKDLEMEQGGPGVYNINLKKNYILENPEWKSDIMPEFLNGKNVYDFVDPDIEAKLAELEAEEEKLEQEGFYNSDSEVDDEEDIKILEKAKFLKERNDSIRRKANSKKALRNRAILPRTMGLKTISEMNEHLTSIGLNTSSICERLKSQSKTTSDSKQLGEDANMKDVKKSYSRAPVKNRNSGITDPVARSRAEKLAKLYQRKLKSLSMVSESDRRIINRKPRHLYSGKRKSGKTDRR